MVLHPSPVLVMPSSNASFSLFGGRVLDDLPVISPLINICLLVKVGWRLHNQYRHSHAWRHTHITHNARLVFIQALFIH